MKNSIRILAVLCVMGVLLSGCATETAGSPLFPAGEVKTVYISSLPEYPEHEFVLQNGDAAAVVDYLEGLTLISDFEENPDHYNGMAWDIRLVYADGSECRVVHFGNVFIRGEDARWYKMDYDQAIGLDALLAEM